MAINEATKGPSASSTATSPPRCASSKNLQREDLGAVEEGHAVALLLARECFDRVVAIARRHFTNVKVQEPAA